MLAILSSCFWKLFTLELELLVVEFEGDALDTAITVLLAVAVVVAVDSSPGTDSFVNSSVSLLLTWTSLLLSSFPLMLESLSDVSLLLLFESDSFSHDRTSLGLFESALSSPLLSPFDWG